MNFINRNEIANGVYFTNIKDSRFKTMKISVNIVVEFRINHIKKLSAFCRNSVGECACGRIACSFMQKIS